MKNKDLMDVLKQQPMDAEIWIEVWDPCTEGYAGEPTEAIILEFGKERCHRIKIRSAWKG